jgi:hypothetical protein
LPRLCRLGDGGDAHIFLGKMTYTKREESSIPAPHSVRTA